MYSVQQLLDNCSSLWKEKRHVLKLYGREKGEKEHKKPKGGTSMPREENVDLGKPKENSKRCADGDTGQDGNLPEKKDERFVCPVCGKPMSEKYLPDKKGYIDERLHAVGEFRIIAKTVLECDFIHFWDEELDGTVDEPHDLTATVDVAFDKSGECTGFDIVKIRPAEKTGE